MGLRLGIWSALVVVVFAALLAAVPSALKAAHSDWPTWPIALAGAALAAVAGLAKPIAGVVTQRWAGIVGKGLTDRDRVRELEKAAGGLRLAGTVTDRALLGIHPAIPLPPGADESLATDLPLYIPRDVDADLRAWVTAHQKPGGFLLLVGPSAAGKTRTAYELVHGTLATWPMFMPSTAAQLTEYFEAKPSGKKLIVWLNETRRFLGPDGLTAGTVRRILTQRHPVIIIGTMWPRDYDRLTGTATTALDDSSEDTREILVMLAQRKDLRPEFSATERDRAGDLAARDPRIAEAIDTDSLRLAETLAAASDLISRWLTAADPYGAAVITAAITARRCGHPEPLPATVLEPLAAALLAPADRGQAMPGWFRAALTWARIPVRGTAAPLTPYGTTPGVIDGDQVSDVLVQQAARNTSTPGHIIAEASWMLVIKHASPEACQDIGYVAYEDQASVAEDALRKAADAGYAGVYSNLGVLLRDRGRLAEAERWQRKAIDAGSVGAMTNLGNLLGDQGHLREAEEWHRKAAEAGIAPAMYNLANLLTDQGRLAEAERWYRRAIEAGSAPAMYNLGNLLSVRTQLPEAERWYRKAADTGHAFAMINLGNLLSDQGKLAEAEQWYRNAAGTANAGASGLFNLGNLLADQGQLPQAEQWYRKAADTGHPGAMINLGNLLADQGRQAEAEQWYRKAASSAHAAASSRFNLRNLVWEQGENDADEQWYHHKKASADGTSHA